MIDFCKTNNRALYVSIVFKTSTARTTRGEPACTTLFETDKVVGFLSDKIVLDLKLLYLLTLLILDINFLGDTSGF